MKILLPAAIIFCGQLTVVNPALAQSWTQTIAPIGYWGTVASSADGSKLVVAAYQVGPIYTSTNSGMMWMSNNVPLLDWSSVASSADGSEFLAVNRDENNLVYISTNSGITWMSNNVPGSLGITCSADGTKIIVADGGIFTSTNLGATWTTNYPYANYAESVACSADGTKIIAVGYHWIYTSTNSGATWTQTSEPGFQGISVASSTDGSKLVAANIVGPVYISTNFGANWTSNDVPMGCASVASSADGSKLEAVNGMVYISTNFGANWTTNNLPIESWWGVASSADGNRLVAVAGGSGFPYGPGPIDTLYVPPSPVLNLGSSSGNLAFSWLVPSTNFVLQQNSDLATTNWVTMTNAPTLNLTNLQDEVILSPSNSSGFYRLMAQ
jgi:hypothetical protein